MSEIVTTQRGGAAAAGSVSSNVTTQSRVATSALSDAERAKVEKLFASPKKLSANLYYHLERMGSNGLEATDALAEDLPATMIDNLKSTLK